MSKDTKTVTGKIIVSLSFLNKLCWGHWIYIYIYDPVKLDILHQWQNSTKKKTWVKMRPVIWCYFRKMIKGNTSWQWIRQQLKMKEKEILKRIRKHQKHMDQNHKQSNGGVSLCQVKRESTNEKGLDLVNKCLQREWTHKNFTIYNTKMNNITKLNN